MGGGEGERGKGGKWRKGGRAGCLRVQPQNGRDLNESADPVLQLHSILANVHNNRVYILQAPALSAYFRKNHTLKSVSLYLGSSDAFKPGSADSKAKLVGPPSVENALLISEKLSPRFF